MDYQAIIESLFRGLIGERFIVFALAAIGLNLHFGYTGLLNFGQAVFMAAGAYGLAMTVVTIGPAVNRNTGLNMSDDTLFWVGVFVAVFVFPVLFALVMGIPTLRLRGSDYLAIVTIAVAEIFRIVARSPSLDKWTGSSDGLTGFTSTFYDLSPFTTTDRYFFNLFTGNQFFLVLVGWTILALGTLICWLMIRSPWGRVLKAIREDEDAARSLGKNAYSYKMQALILGGMFGAVGGMVRAIGFSVAQPDNFITDVTFFVYVALILGGAGKVFGPLVGAALLYAVLDSSDTILRQLVANDYIPDSFMSGTQVGQVRFMIVGLGLILLAAFRPQGIFGNKEEMALDADKYPREDDYPSMNEEFDRSSPFADDSHVTAGPRPDISDEEAEAGYEEVIAVEGVDPVAARAALADVPWEPGAPKPDPILIADNVVRRFGGLTAVDVDHVEVQRGVITALIGPNGAGKTTLFNLLTNFDTPDSGTRVFNDKNIDKVAAHNIAGHGMVRTFQLTKALSKMTVIENMKLGATDQKGESLFTSIFPFLWRKQEKEIEARADDLLIHFKMDHIRDQFAGTLSGGQRKLLEMARALMVEPEMVMLDEPMAGVNPALTQSLLGHVTGLRDQGMTVLFVEHDMDMVQEISDWVIVMAEGQIIAEGPPASIGENKAVVDAYLGSSHDSALDLEQEL